MAAEQFIGFLKEEIESENWDTVVDFAKFKQEKLITTTPQKVKISPLDSVNLIGSQMRNAIISNLSLNSVFLLKCSRIKCRFLKNLDNILLITKDAVNKDQFVQLIFLLNLSKSKIEEASEWHFFLVKFVTLSQHDQNDYSFIEPIEKLFDKLKSNIFVQKRLKRVVLEITDVLNFEFDLNQFLSNELQLILFSCKIPGLKGFAGFNSIFVNIAELSSKYEIINGNDHSAFDLLKLEFTRLFVHEVCHVIIRKVFKDINFSTPKLERSKKSNILEAGIYSEETFFCKKIDWIASFSSNEFNRKYCLDFFLNLLKDENVTFDFIKSGCIENKRANFLMAVDYEKPRDHYLEFF